MVKIGRNEPCPCGSGKKYKKCCLINQKRKPSQDDIKQVIKIFQKREQKINILREKGIFINYVKPCNGINPKTGDPYRAWAIGNTVYLTKMEHETFHEFLINRLRNLLGKKWWEDQIISKDKHFIFECFIKWDEWLTNNFNKAENVDSYTKRLVMNGWTKTLLSLAFDVCSLEHTRQLPDYLIKRLRKRNEYQGAHYEIAIAAIFSRLGCSIDFLDKQSISTKHCEFIVTHKETGTKIAVEVKSRQRPGVKHFQGCMCTKPILKDDVHSLLSKALKQNPKNMPFIVFIDMNLPLTPEIPLNDKAWIIDIKNMVNKFPKPTAEKPKEYMAVFFTNFSSHYNAEYKSEPNEYFDIIPKYANYSMPSPIFHDMLLKAIANYGFVPNIEET